MHSILAYAEAQDGSYMSSEMVLWGMLIIAGVALAGFVLVYVSRRQKHRGADLVLAGAFFWGIVAAGSLLYVLQSQMNWTKEYTVRIESGYVEPKDLSDKPRVPWGILVGLGVVYLGMGFWVISGKRVEE
jgi:hypothetical protein